MVEWMSLTHGKELEGLPIASPSMIKLKNPNKKCPKCQSTIARLKMCACSKLSHIGAESFEILNPQHQEIIEALYILTINNGKEITFGY